MLIKRNIQQKVEAALARQAAVALIGPRQVGKTTLALNLAKKRRAVYLDLESYQDRQKLNDPILFFRQYQDYLVILDEIHRMPELFQTLRGVIDEGRREGVKVGRFLILGSASIELLRQSGESLAGRIAYVDMTPFLATELSSKLTNKLWLRGGFPESFLSHSNEESFAIRRDFIRTYLERDIPQFGPRAPAQTLERLWMMLAHSQGGMLNLAKLSASLGIATKTVGIYVDLLSDLFLFRRLEPYVANVKKRLVKAPKCYIRDSGILHALLMIKSEEEIFGHPVSGMSWEGFVIENILSVLPYGTQASFYRTSSGAEVDLVLEVGSALFALEIKSGLQAKPSRGFYSAIDDISPDRAVVVHRGDDSFSLSEDVQAMSLPATLEWFQGLVL